MLALRQLQHERPIAAAQDKEKALAVLGHAVVGGVDEVGRDLIANLGKSPLYGSAWRAGRRCLIPADWIYEPCYETGKNVWHRIGLADWRTMCVAGIWRTLTGPDGVEHHAMSMITVNGDGHPVFSRMHKPDDEKRAVVILHSDDWEEWLRTSNVEAARAMLQLYPADEMVAEPDTRG